MEIKRVGSQASGKGSVEYFTGTVRIDPLFEAHAPVRALGSSVTFEPGARTAWHTHPLGQTLIVTILGVAGFNAKADRSRRSVPLMSSGSLQKRNTGMGRRRQRE